MGRLDGKTIIVIGGAQGIGRGCVLAAASEGARVVVGDLNEAGAHDVAAEAYGTRHDRDRACAVDVVDRDQVDALVADRARRVRPGSTAWSTWRTGTRVAVAAGRALEPTT